MRTTKTIQTAEHRIDVALEILTTHCGKSLEEISKALNKLGTLGFKINKGTLSKVRGIHREPTGRYVKLVRVGLTKNNKRTKLADSLAFLLATEYNIPFTENLFIVDGVKYGIILPDDISIIDDIIVPDEPIPDVIDPMEISDIKHDQIYESIINAKKVRILHTYLTSSILFMQKAKLALNNKCDFKILLAEPNSELIRLRAKGLRHVTTEKVEQKAIDNYIELKQLSENPEFKDYFQFRIYNELPGPTFFQIDDDVYVCFQWFGKFSDDGSYIHLHKDNKWAIEILANFDSIWKSLDEITWDIDYNMYLLREGDLGVRRIQINSFTNEALLTRTASGSIFKGPVIRNQGNCVNISLQTIPSDSSRDLDNRTANLLLPVSREKIKDRRLIVGLYMVEYIDDKMLSNVVILENVNPPINTKDALSEERKMMLAEAYLRRNPSISEDSEIRLDTSITSWGDIVSKTQ